MLRARQKIGKYRIVGRIASGPLADVYRAYDTIQKRRVALKIPKADVHTGHEEFLHEVQVATKLQHPNILTVLNASYIDGHFVIAMELGEESLADRIERRISTARALDLAGQAIAALAYGTETIRPVATIVGPGNAYVAAAKRQVFGRLNLEPAHSVQKIKKPVKILIC